MISVCMATYNGEKYLRQQIDSILSQLGNDDELIISDDGSTDGTLVLIKEINDDRIKLYNHLSAFPKKKKLLDLHTINHYISYNFLNSLNKAKGDYIFLSDQDDIWYATKIKISMDALKKSDMIMSNFSIIDQNGNILTERFRNGKPFKDDFILNALNPHFTGCVMAFKREILRYVFPFPKDISCGHDNWIGTCFTKFGKIMYIDEPLLYHRLHDINNSPLCRKSPNNIAQKINLRMCLLFNILFKQK